MQKNALLAVNEIPQKNIFCARKFVLLRQGKFSPCQTKEKNNFLTNEIKLVKCSVF